MPLLDAVNIPLHELSDRIHELPPKRETVLVVAQEPLLSQALALLRELGREAEPGTSTYTDRSARARLWAPNAFLESVVSEIVPGRALDLACGTGRDAVYLASCGFKATGLDHLPDALERARRLAARYLSDAEPPRFEQADVEADEFEIDSGFDLITMFYFLHRPLIPKCIAALNRGGSLVMETFTDVHREHRGKPSRDWLVLRSGEARKLVDGMRVRRFDEDWRSPEVHTARVWAQKR